jgi:diadenylate cyclase
VDFADRVVRIAQAVQAEAVICVTESGVIANSVIQLGGELHIIPATPNQKTYQSLVQANIDAIRLPIHVADKYRQVRHTVSVALKSGRISVGQLIVCALSRDVFREEGELILVTDVEASAAELPVTDLIKLTDGIRPLVLETALAVACKIARAARRGNRVGAILMLGDAIKVLEGSRQLVPNPVHGHDQSSRMLTNPEIQSALVELSKLDGAFVLRGDGFIETAAVFLAPGEVQPGVPAGLGARHVAAAAVTARTSSTAVVVSATDGNVRVFAGGVMVLQIDPDVSVGLVLPEL